MRHKLTAGPIAPCACSMRKASAAGELVALSGFANAVAACVGGAVAAVSIAAVTLATDEDLRPTAGAQVQAARRRLHWRFPLERQREGASEIDGPCEQCDTGSSRGSPAGHQASQMDTLWRRGAGLDLAVEAGIAPVVLPWQTPFYHVATATRCRARLQSPSGLPTPRPASPSCHSQHIRCFHYLDCSLQAATPLYDAAQKARKLTAIDMPIRGNRG